MAIRQTARKFNNANQGMCMLLCYCCLWQGTLSRKFKVNGIPTLVFVQGKDGHQITSEGRRIVMEDPEGKDFPWTPKPLFELLQGELLTKDGKTTWEEVKGTVDFLGIYFSAHWVSSLIRYILYSPVMNTDSLEIMYAVHVHVAIEEFKISVHSLGGPEYTTLKSVRVQFTLRKSL